MFGRITGQRLTLAKIYIANYCAALEWQAGTIDIYYVIYKINKDYKLVSEEDVAILAQDIQCFVDCLKNQQINAIDRGGYWKFRALSPNLAKDELKRELNALVDV